MIEAPNARGRRRALPFPAMLTLFGGIAIGATALSPVAAQQARTLGAIAYNVVTCHSGGACAGGVNTANGIGVVGVASGNNGLDGATKYPSNTTHVGRSGVYGHDDSTDGGNLNVGVAGFSPNGIGMEAASTNGTGLYATSTNWITVNAWGGFGNTLPALYVRGGTYSDPSGTTIEADDATGHATFTVDNAGNAHLKGLLYTGGSCSQGCSRSRRVASYAPRESMPSMEDVGEGQLVNGKAHVRLDPAFANVVDLNAPYAVFVSPEGPSRGLYVTQKDRTGFTVTENPGGSATISFSYRIVAKPYGVTAARLPVTDDSRSPRHRQMARLATAPLAR
jgi:hypothetical protein